MIRRELHAARGGLSIQDLARVMNDEQLNAFTRAELLCTALPTPLKELARAHYRSQILFIDKNGRSQATNQITRELERLRSLGLERSIFEALAVLPPYSLGIEFSFTLFRPYLSRDDDAFYIIDNPVRKEKVFKVPYVAPISWKGSLRTAATRDLIIEMNGMIPDPVPEAGEELDRLYEQLWSRRAQRVLLFGNEKEANEDAINDWLAGQLFSEKLDDPDKNRSKRLQISFDKYLKDKGYRTERIKGRQGRLFFFPTYFDQIGLEVINPHDRKRGVGTNPILFECVPRGAKGCFNLLYIPFDYPGLDLGTCSSVTPDQSALIAQIQADLPVITRVIQALFTVYGFGAKTSSGYGTVEDQLTEPGRLVLKARLPELAEKTLSVPEIEPFLTEPGSLEDFITPEGNFRSEEDYSLVLQARGQQYTRKKRQLYRKAKHGWESGGQTTYRRYQLARTSEHTVLFFSSLTELPQVAQRLAEVLENGGAA